MDTVLVYRMKDLPKVLGIGRSTIYNLIKEGDFPQPIELGPNSVGWLVDEVKDWLSNRDRRI